MPQPGAASLGVWKVRPTRRNSLSALLTVVLTSYC
jgi:hypothetical protein